MTATGVGKLTCCHPEEVSPENTAVASRVPEVDHKLPMWVPLFAVPFQNRTPVTYPFTSARNFTPSSTALGSFSTWLTGTADGDQIVHGQTGPAAVVKVQVTLDARRLPAMSFTVGSVVPPLRVAWYAVLAASAADGVSLAVRVAGS